MVLEGEAWEEGEKAGAEQVAMGGRVMAKVEEKMEGGGAVTTAVTGLAEAPKAEVK